MRKVGSLLSNTAGVTIPLALILLLWLGFGTNWWTPPWPVRMIAQGILLVLALGLIAFVGWFFWTISFGAAIADAYRTGGGPYHQAARAARNVVGVLLLLIVLALLLWNRPAQVDPRF